MGNLCIIPARGGSKRIPRKNIREFLGKPIIAYTIETALNSGLFEEVMVSTDDKEIAEIATKYGAKVPFIRSKENANDFATTADVINEVIESYLDVGKSFSYICCCYPTAPFITQDILKLGLQELIENSWDSVFPVVEFSYPIWRSLKKDRNNAVSMNWPEYLNSRSQDLPKAFHDAGQWYWFNLEEFNRSGKILGDNSFGFEINALQVQDIDSDTDWKIAELKYQLLENIQAIKKE